MAVAGKIRRSHDIHRHSWIESRGLAGIEHIGKPEGYGATKRAEYIRNDYHKETDVPKPDWDLSGAVEDLAVLLEVGYRAAEQPGRPAWKPDAVWRPKGM